MPNIASVLKAEVARLARKELRAATEGLKKSVAGQRAEISALKSRVRELEQRYKLLSRAASQPAAKVATATSGEDVSGLRFRAAGMAANRKRLGLSAADFGLLVGATGQSIYAWETGKAKPRAQNLTAIAALRGVGKKEVVARLAALKQR